MRKVEKLRVREGLTKRALAAEIGASEDGLHSWISGRSIGWQETVAKIKRIPQEEGNCGSVRYCSEVIRSTEKSLRSRPSFTAASAITRVIENPTATGSRAGSLVTYEVKYLRIQAMDREICASEHFDSNGTGCQNWEWAALHHSVQRDESYDAMKTVIGSKPGQYGNMRIANLIGSVEDGIY